MAINFPSNPTLNQTFTSGTKTFVWNGTSWTSSQEANISVDTTPQLGGDLDINGNDITGTGNINITGIVTATGGFNIGIQSAGVNVTTGVITALNFIGSGNTFAYDSSSKTIDISIAGGGGGSGIGISNVVEDTTPQLGGNLDLNSNNITGTGNVNITGDITASNVTVGGTLTYDDVTNVDSIGLITARSGIVATGVVTATSFVKSSNSGGFLKADGTEDTSTYLTSVDPTNTDIQGMWSVGGNTSGFTFTGPGQDGSEYNPDIYLVRGQRYRFVNSLGSNHPFEFRNAANNADYTDGITGSQSGTQDFNVQHDAPPVLKYRCTIHTGSMLGTIYIIGGTQVISGIVTATGFSTTTGTSSQFLKADGSVDSNTYLTSYTETQTLDDVLGLGNTSTTGLSVGVVTATEAKIGSAAPGSTLTTINSSGVNVSGGGINVTGVVTASSFVKSGGTSSQFLKADGSVDSSTYLTSYTETDPVVGAINGIVKADGGGNISAATAGTDYLTPSGDGSGLSGIVTNIQAGTNITVSESPAGNFIITSTSSGGSSLWTQTGYTGIGTTSAVGIGTIIEIIPYDTQNNGTLSFEGSAGQLFSITNELSSGSIFSVNDISGIPSIDVDADGTIQLAPFGANERVGIGTTNPSTKLHVDGIASFEGSVGIGTTNPIANTKLHVNGIVAFGSSIYDSNQSFGNTDQVLTSIAGFGVSWTTVTGGGTGISNVSDDTNPQLGGPLDLNNHRIFGTGSININGITTATGFSTIGGTSSQFLKADGSVDSSTYITSYTETDPVVAAINGIVKSNGSTISAATAGTDYLAPSGDGSGLTGIVTNIQAGSNITVVESPTGNFIVTATSISNVSDDTNPQLGGDLDLNSNNITGTGSINITGGATFSGNVTVGGTLTYDDVTNIDSIGLITARNGIHVTSGVSTFAGDVSFGSTATFGDDDKIIFGDGGFEFQIYHNGSKSIIRDNGPGNLLLGSNGTAIKLTKGLDTEKLAIFNVDGSVELYYDDSKKFETTGAGVTITGVCTATSFVKTGGTASQYLMADGSVSSGGGGDSATLGGISSTGYLRSDVADIKTSGNLTFNDGIQAQFGTDADLKIYHNGTKAFITNSNDGNLVIQNNVDDYDVVINCDDGSGATTEYFRADGSSGESRLSHYGSLKLATKSNGIDVTGHTETDTLNVSGIATATGFSTSGGTSSQFLKADGSVDSSTYISSIGISSAGTSIGNATTLNFIGTGNTFAVNGNTIDISIEGGGGGGIGTYFSEQQSTSSPNNVNYVSSFTGIGTTTNIDVAIVPKGNGSFSLSVPDGTTTGGNKRGVYAVDLQLSRSNADNVAAGRYSFIGGGVQNRIVDSGSFSWSSAIVAGDGNSIDNSSASATVGGYFNQIEKSNRSIVLGGSGSIIAASSMSYTTNSAIVGGSNNKITDSNYSTIIGGYKGTTKGVHGIVVLPASNGPLGTGETHGAVQATILNLARETTDATPTVIASDNTAASTDNQLVLLNNSALAFKGTCIAGVTGAGNTKAWEFRGAIKRGANAASTTLVGSVIKDVLAYDAGAATWDVDFTADTTNGALKVTVTGQVAPYTIRWVCKIETTELAF